jgi:hypothetical protein
MNSLVYFKAMNRYASGGSYTQEDLLASNTDNRDLYVITNHNGFFHSSAQNQHIQLLLFVDNWSRHSSLTQNETPFALPRPGLPDPDRDSGAPLY